MTSATTSRPCAVANSARSPPATPAPCSGCSRCSSGSPAWPTRPSLGCRRIRCWCSGWASPRCGTCSPGSPSGVPWRSGSMTCSGAMWIRCRCCRRSCASPIRRPCCCCCRSARRIATPARCSRACWTGAPASSPRPSNWVPCPRRTLASSQGGCSRRCDPATPRPSRRSPPSPAAPPSWSARWPGSWAAARTPARRCWPTR